jgi:Sap, sulfolipid-1-addressing protein
VWMSVLLLAIAVNFEPTRIALIPLLLSREKPRRQLLAFLIGSLTVSVCSAMLILFAFHRTPFGIGASSVGHVQIVIGVIALSIAAFMAVRWMITPARHAQDLPNPGHFSVRVRKLLQKSNAPWIAGIVGAGTGLPSLDSLAVIAIIAASQTPPVQQVAALLLFNLIGSLMVLATLAALLMASASTLSLLDRFGIWIRSRKQMEYAVLLAAVGMLLIIVGFA